MISSIRLTPPTRQGLTLAWRGALIVAVLLVGMALVVTGFSYRHPTLGTLVALLFMLAPPFVERIRMVRAPTYELDESGISFLDPKAQTPTFLAWTEIDKVHCSQQGKITLSGSGVKRVVEISPLQANYLQVIPILLGKLSPLWRALSQPRYDKSHATYWMLLYALIVMVGGVAAFATNPVLALLAIGAGIAFIYDSFRYVQRIQLTSDGVEITKGHGNYLIPATAITTITLDPARGGGTNAHPLLLVMGERQIRIDGYLNSTLLYFVLTLWHRDQFVSNSGWHL